VCGKGAERWVVGRGIGMWREMGVEWMDGWMVGWGGGSVIVCQGGEMVEEDCMRSRGLGGLAMRRGIHDYERLVER